MYSYEVSRKQIIVFLYLLAFVVLWLGYAFFIIPIYKYEGYIWSPNVAKVMESIFIIVFFAFFLPSNFKKPSDFFVHVHFLLPILPMLVLYGTSDYSREYMFFVVFAFLIVCVIRKINMPKIQGDILPASLVMWGSLIFVIIYILLIISQGGLAYFNLDLRKVYEYRSAAAENLPGIAGYLSPLISNILLPYILVISLAERKRHISLLAIIGSIIMFSLTSHKSTLFYPFIASAIYFIIRSEKLLILKLLGAYIIFAIASLFPFFLEKILSSEPTFLTLFSGSLGFRRAYFVPSFLNFAYFDFFSTHPYTMWAESKFTFGLVYYPYNLPSPYVIGYYFFDDVNTGANTGWLGSGYMQLGFLGMVLYAFIIGLFLAMVDLLAKNKEYSIIIALLMTPFLGLFVAVDLPTASLTHGLLFAIFLVWIIRLNKVNIEPINPSSGIH